MNLFHIKSQEQLPSFKINSKLEQEKQITVNVGENEHVFIGIILGFLLEEQ